MFGLPSPHHSFALLTRASAQKCRHGIFVEPRLEMILIPELQRILKTKKPPLAVSSSSDGGGAGNRTPVRKRSMLRHYILSRYFSLIIQLLTTKSE